MARRIRSRGIPAASPPKTAQAGEAMEDGFSLLPLYLRAPQAERERAAREAASRD